MLLTCDIFLSDISGLENPLSLSHLKDPGDPGKVTDKMSASLPSAPPLTRLRKRDTSFWK